MCILNIAKQKVWYDLKAARINPCLTTKTTMYTHCALQTKCGRDTMNKKGE